MNGIELFEGTKQLPNVYEVLQQDIFHNSSNKIKNWWKKYNSINELNKIYNHTKSELSNNTNLQKLSNCCEAIKNVSKGDGAGLTGGTLTDMFISKFFQENVKEFTESHSGESDMKIYNTKLSLKKINGKSTIALDWSKNDTDNKKNYFNTHIIIINLKTQQWWKTTPNKSITNNKIITYNDEIKMGIYFIDKKYCKRYIKLSSNNKTNSLIDSQYLYLMLQRSIRLRLYLELPTPNKNVCFNILHAFSE
jgi:hypothetical protein